VDKNLIPEHDTMNSVVCIVYDMPKTAVRRLLTVLSYIQTEHGEDAGLTTYCTRCVTGHA
jgi:hypothetical protein